MAISLFEFSKQVIDLFLEYRDKHGVSEDEAKEKAALDSSDPDTGFELVDKLEVFVKNGHTRHCAQRLLWGDGECECEKKGIIPGLISQTVIEATNDH
jgi:hypothetical protein